MSRIGRMRHTCI